MPDASHGGIADIIKKRKDWGVGGREVSMMLTCRGIQARATSRVNADIILYYSLLFWKYVNMVLAVWWGGQDVTV